MRNDTAVGTAADMIVAETLDSTNWRSRSSIGVINTLFDVELNCRDPEKLNADEAGSRIQSEQGSTI